MPKVEELQKSASSTQAPKVVVNILDDHGHVDRDPVHISKSKNEQVSWNHRGTAKIAIQFKKHSPFAKGNFEVSPNGSCPSGDQRKEISAGQHFAYTVGQNDPVVIIDP